MQLKAFARVQGKPETLDEDDKIFVSLAYAYDQDLAENVVYKNSHVEEKLILTAFVLLTALIGLVLVWLTTQYYETLWKNMNGLDKEAKENQDNSETAENNMDGQYTEQDGKRMNSQDNGKSAHAEQNSSVQYSLYWSTAFVFCCFDICNIGVFIIAQIFRHPNLTTTDYVVRSAFITKMVIMPTLYILHLVVAIFAVHKSQKSQPSSYTSKVLCVLAIYSILIFIQTIGAAVIPLFILLLLYTFKVLSVFAFMASSTFCFIILIAHILLLNAREGRKGILLLQACIIVVFLAVIGVLVAFYLFLLSRGVDTKGLQGFLLSLIPSLVLAVVGGYIKEFVLKKEGEQKTKRQIIETIIDHCFVCCH